MQVASKSLARLFIIILGIGFLAGCQTTPEPKKTSIELQVFQSKEFATTLKVAFASTLSVFQDLGYTVNSADLDTGFITAKSPTSQSFVLFVGQKMENTRATAFVESLGSNRIRVRLNFVNSVQTSSGYGMKGEDEKPVEDPVVYRDAFKKIQKAIFVRTNLN